MSPRKKPAARRTFGQIRPLPSGKFQARYKLPGAGQSAPYINAPKTFDTEASADVWLTVRRAELIQGTIAKPKSKLSLRDYCKEWLHQRPRRLKDKTRCHYIDMLNKFILPTLGPIPLADFDPTIIRSWYARTAVDTPTYRAQSYTLLKSIFKTALHDDLIAANPCRIDGAGSSRRASKTVPATLEELEIIHDAVPNRYQLMILLAAWCAMRFGELAELRAFDLDFKRKEIKVRRGVTWVNGNAVIGQPTLDPVEDESKTRASVDTPKSDAGARDIAIPPHLMPVIRAHIREYCAGPHSLLFPAARDAEKNMRPATLYKVYYPARLAAGRKDLRFHDLRHTGATLYAQTGATLAELMDRIGHSTPAAAMRYQHAANGRAAKLAEMLTQMSVTLSPEEELPAV